MHTIIIHYELTCAMFYYRILFSTDSTQLSFEALPSIAAKYTYLKQLLVDKQVGGILCSKFRSVTGSYCWQTATRFSMPLDHTGNHQL